MAVYNRGIPGKAPPFLFIHIYRTGGTSLRSMLVSRHWGRQSREIHGSHPLARDVKNHMAKAEFDQAFKFSFIRNPFDWLVSIYSYIRQVPSHPDHATVTPMEFPEFVRWWCHDMMKRDYIYGTNGCTTLTGFLTDTDGSCLVDYIGRMERFDTDAAEVAERIGFGPDFQVPHLNKARRSSTYRSRYDATAHEIAEEAFAEDLLRFNYQF